jgi:hypothetical protein
MDIETDLFLTGVRIEIGMAKLYFDMWLPVEVELCETPWPKRPRVCVFIETLPDRAVIRINKEKLRDFMRKYCLPMRKIIRHEFGHILAYRAGAEDEHAWIAEHRPDLVLDLRSKS